MLPDDEPILTEDGQRLTINEGEITGTDNSEPGLAFQTGNVLDSMSDSGKKEEEPPAAARAGEGIKEEKSAQGNETP